MIVYFSGPGGVGKATSMNWLTDHYAGSQCIRQFSYCLDSLEESDCLEDTIMFFAKQKLKRDALVREQASDNSLVLCNRSYLDPLALAMTLLPEERWQSIAGWHNQHEYVPGLHVLLLAPPDITRERRLRRGWTISGGTSSFLKNSDLSQEEYEALFVENLRAVHGGRRVSGMLEVDFSSAIPEENRERLIRTVGPLIESALAGVER